MKQETSLKIFKFIAWFIGIYHVILGLIGIFASADLIGSVINAVYHLTIVADPRFLIAAHFASSYMLALGIMMIFVAMKPREYKVFVWAAIAMFAARLFDHLLYLGTIEQSFNSTLTGNLITIISILVFGLGLFIFRPRD
ncbi:MAG: hypothetical protein Q8P07_01410 [bacterium]|nr:hypothetical protein [bacterium]